MKEDAICKNCNKDFIKRTEYEMLCPKCNDEAWKVWEKDEKESLEQIVKIQKAGHSHHCACRQVWGDGECECHMYKNGYNPYWWMRATNL